MQEKVRDVNTVAACFALAYYGEIIRGKIPRAVTYRRIMRWLENRPAAKGRKREEIAEKICEILGGVLGGER